MRRLLLALGLLFLPSLVDAACTNRCDVKAACTASAPCNWSASSTWYDGAVGEGTACAGAGGIPDATTWLNPAAGRYVVLNTDAVFCSDGAGHNFFQGSLVSDGNRRSMRLIGDANDGTTDMFLNSTFQLKGGDRMLCDANGSANKRCLFQWIDASSWSFFMDGTIGSEQTGTVSNVGTTYTVSGITTTGYIVGDMLWWTSGAAQSYPYELTAVTASSISYRTDLPNSSSLDLYLTPDQGSLGGAPASLHTLPSVVPVTGDRFRLVAPVKWAYDTVDGGWWSLNNSAAASFAAGVNLRLNGFSITGSTGTDGIRPMDLKFAATHTGIREMSFMNLGHHLTTTPYWMSGQGLGMDYVYCHDSRTGSGTAGSCLDIQPCTVGACGAAYAVTNAFVGHFHGTRTGEIPLSVCAESLATNCSNNVVWEPVVHDLTNANNAETCGVQMGDCDNCLLYRGAAWNITDPADGSGFGYCLSGDGTGSVIMDSYSLNSGTGIRVAGGFTASNVYSANQRGEAFECNATSGTLTGAVGYAWAQNSSGYPGARNCNIDGAILVGSTAQASAPGIIQDASAVGAKTIRNVLIKNNKGIAAVYIDASNTQDVTVDHLVCGGPVSGAHYCFNDQSANAHTVLLRDTAANVCGGQYAFNMQSATPTTTQDRTTINTTASTGCLADTSNWDNYSNVVSATDLGFSGANDYNLNTTSILRRAGNQPANSPRGVRCARVDTSRFRPGFTADLSWTNIYNETCVDPDKDGWLTLPLGATSPDSCDGVADLMNAATCANGETPPGKRVFP